LCKAGLFLKNEKEHECQESRMKAGSEIGPGLLPGKKLYLKGGRKSTGRIRKIIRQAVFPTGKNGAK